MKTAVALLILLVGPSLVSAADARLADAAMKGDGRAVAALLEQKVDVNAPGVDGTPALHWLVRADDLAMVERLIRAGANVKAGNRYGVTPLHLAITNGNAAMVRTLLDAGADPDGSHPTGDTALMTAAREGTPEVVRALLDRGAAVNARDPAFQQTALMWAVRENHPAVVRMLLERGAEVHATTRVGPVPAFRPPGAGGGSHGVGIVRSGIPPQGARVTAPGAMTALLYATRDGRLDIARTLLDAGAHINEPEVNGIAPLLMAITNDHLDVARVLLDAGADVNAVDWYGRTPLWAAVEIRNLDFSSATEDLTNNGVDRAAALAFIELLLRRGATPNARIKEVPPVRRWLMPLGSLAWVDFTGQTPFLLASLSGDVPLMRLLLANGADPTITTFGGTTALMAAAGVNWVVKQTFTESAAMSLDAVTLCLELGGDVAAVNSMGLTAMHGAANRGSDDIVELLAARGANLEAKDKEGRTPLVWAEGVFLATHPPVAKPSTIALIKKLTAAGAP
jgi:ankyrin repeat protein